MPNLVLCSKEDADNYLMHFRTKGSKNGVRLYQYKDGSLTPLGREHYGVGQGSNRKWLTSAFDNASGEKKRRLGDKILSSLEDDNGDLDAWLVDKINKKHLMDSSIDQIENKRIRDCKKQLNECKKEMYSRRSEIEEKYNYDDRKIRKALQKDPVYQKAEKEKYRIAAEYTGEVLKDLGFNDIPENRIILLLAMPMMY